MPRSVIVGVVLGWTTILGASFVPEIVTVSVEVDATVVETVKVVLVTELVDVDVTEVDVDGLVTVELVIVAVLLLTVLSTKLVVAVLVTTTHRRLIGPVPEATVPAKFVQLS